MTLLSGENINKQYDDQVIFRELSFSIGDNDRIGLVGPNGIGKTTLFEIMAGRISTDSGQVVRPKKCLIDYVEQEIIGYDDMTLSAYVSSARQDLIDMKKEIDDVAHKLEEQPESARIIEKLGELQHRFELEGGYELENRLKTIMLGLGFPEDRFGSRLGSFYGGERNRAALAKLLAGKGNLLLLDEPTNHLDIESTIWLEEYLKELNKAYIIVSHDRTFLTNTIEKVWEISGGKIEQYFNGFEKYLEERRERKEQQLHLYRHQQEEIKRIEDFIRRNMAGQKTRQAQSKQKYLARIKRIDKPLADREMSKLTVESGERSFNLVLMMQSASFGYGNRRLISDADFNLYRGDRVGLIGPNGSGKSTILKTILGLIDAVEGSVEIGNKVEVAYFDQELSDLSDDNSVLDELWLVDPLTEAGRLRTFLARFGFRGEDVFKKVSVLSGGEKTKLALAKILFMPANLLIFDEPTNHLDLDSRQALEEALLNYGGTYLIVSHDRYFLDKIARRIAALEKGTVKIYQGNYSYYREKKDADREIPRKKETDPERISNYERFKKESQRKGQLKKDIRSTISKIQDYEKILARLEKDVNFNIPKTDWEKLAAASKEKTRVEEILLELYARLEVLKEKDAEYSDTERQSD